MAQLPPATDHIFVAVLALRRRLHSARTLGWYGILLRSLPKVVAVECLAFYQANRFWKDYSWRIETVAPLSHELTTRGKVWNDETDHPLSCAENFKTRSGSLQSLPRPIMAAKWQRADFLNTNGELLLSAETVNDLKVHDESAWRLGGLCENEPWKPKATKPKISLNWSVPRAYWP